MFRPQPKRWPVGLAVAGLCAGLALAAAFALPQITTLSPAEGAQEVSARAPVRITFNRPMDQASVQAALKIEPPAPGQLAWQGATLLFTPDSPWAENSTVTITLSGGRSARGLPLLLPRRWSFTVGGRRIAYLAGDVPNLWLLGIAEGSQPRQVTNEASGVYDFDLSADGTRAVYSALRPDGGADLHAINLDGTGATGVLDCPNEACLSPALAPNGRWIAYERHSLATGFGGETSFGPSRVHLLETASGADVALGPVDSQTRTPRWGPDGRLSFIDETRQALVVHDPASGAETYIPDTAGESGTWSPDGRFIVFPEIVFLTEAQSTPAANATPGAEPPHSDQFFSHLFRVTIATNEAQNLSGEGIIEDGSPAYSPSGAWIAFGRKGLQTGDWTPGRQLWLMRADGSEAHAMTSEPLYNHSAFQWSADETQIVYMRFNAAEPGAPAEIWIINRDSTGARKLVAGGYLPEWLP